MAFLRIDSIGGACPMQAEGLICGKPFYFRARHGEWTIDIAETLDEAVDGLYPVAGSASQVLYHASGDDPDLGYMPVTEAARLIALHACTYWTMLCEYKAEGR